MKSKKAQILEESVMWIWRIFMIALIALGVIVIVGTQYESYDIRPVETALLSQKILDCISENGILNPLAMEEQKIEECSGIRGDEYFFEITGIKNISAGPLEIKENCRMVEQKVKLRSPPSCLRQSYVLLEDGKPSLLNLLIGIRKTEKNLK